MYRYPFAVGNTAYCCWGHDLLDRNEVFLAGVDCEYLWYTAQRHFDALGGDDRQRAALALRTIYHHGLETLFSFLGALAQSPGCVPAWLPKCSSSDLRELVQGFLIGLPLLTQRGVQRIDFSGLAKVVHRYCWIDEVPRDTTATRFAETWSRFAEEFLDEYNIAEYNSLKHGFRVRGGGFTLQAGTEEHPGVPAAAVIIQTIGSSEFGSSFSVPQAILNERQFNHHFRLRYAALNWSVEAVVQKLQLLSFSFTNVVGALRCLAGAAPSTMQFQRPEDPAAFKRPWQWSVGIHASSLDLVVEQDEVSRESRPELLEELRNRVPLNSANVL